MKRLSWLAVAATAVVGVTVATTIATGRAEDDAAPVFGVRIPDGYRQWQLITVTHVVHPGVSDEIKAILGNPLAAKAQQADTLPLPDGTVLAKLTWQHAPYGGFDGVNMAGAPVRLEFMVKDSKKYAATGGWGFGRFVDGKPVDEAQHKTCFPCHDSYAKSHDFVFTRFAP